MQMVQQLEQCVVVKDKPYFGYSSYPSRAVQLLSPAALRKIGKCSNHVVCTGSRKEEQ